MFKYTSQAIRNFNITCAFGDNVYAVESCANKSLNKALPLKMKDMLSLNLGSSITLVSLLG